MPIKHLKTNTIPDWTQTEIDAAIANGDLPPGTTPSNMTLASDWYAEKYHRVRIREQQAKLKELVEEVEDNKRFTEEILQELADAKLKADQIRLSKLENVYKKELTKLLQTIIEIKADIRRSEELLVLAICSRRRLRMGMTR